MHNYIPTRNHEGPSAILYNQLEEIEDNPVKGHIISENPHDMMCVGGELSEHDCIKPQADNKEITSTGHHAAMHSCPRRSLMTVISWSTKGP